MPDVRVVRPGFRENVMMPIQAVVGTVPEAILYSRRFKNFAAMCNPSTPQIVVTPGYRTSISPERKSSHENVCVFFTCSGWAALAKAHAGYCCRLGTLLLCCRYPLTPKPNESVRSRLTRCGLR